MSVVAGATLLVLGPTEPRPEPKELSPYSVAAYLRRVAGPDARDLRINGLYGSGHRGAWQFVAALTWHKPDGTVTGGSTNLPKLAGSPTLDSPYDEAKLALEQDIGWTLDDLDRVLDELRDVDDGLVMVELEILPGEQGTAISCRATRVGDAKCEERDRNGDVRRNFDDALTDQPLLEGISVQRASHPVPAYK